MKERFMVTLFQIQILFLVTRTFSKNNSENILVERWTGGMKEFLESFRKFLIEFNESESVLKGVSKVGKVTSFQEMLT